MGKPRRKERKVWTRRYGQEAEKKARRKQDRKEIEGKKGTTVLQVLKGALIIRKKVLF